EDGKRGRRAEPRLRVEWCRGADCKPFAIAHCSFAIFHFGVRSSANGKWKMNNGKWQMFFHNAIQQTRTLSPPPSSQTPAAREAHLPQSKTPAPLRPPDACFVLRRQPVLRLSPSPSISSSLC